MTIQIDRYISDAEIEAYATGILQKYGRQYKPITAPPVPIEDIIDLVVDIPIVREAIPDHHDSPVLAKFVARGHPHPALEIIVNENKQLFLTNTRARKSTRLPMNSGMMSFILTMAASIPYCFQIQRSSLLPFAV